MTVTRRSAIHVCLGMVLLMLIGARARAQGPPPDEIVTSPSPNEAQRAVIKAYVDRHKAGLTGEPAAIKGARNALMAPLLNNQVSVPFRLEYSRLLVPVLSPLVNDPKEMVAVNALLLTGELATGASVDLVAPALADKRPSVRFAATAAYARLLDALATKSPAMAAPQASGVLRQIKRGMGAETDQKVLDGYMLALRSATNVPTAKLAGVRVEAALLLAQEIGAKAKAAQPGTDLDPVFLRAASTVRDAMINPAEPQLPDEVLREAGAMGGEILACARRRLDAGKVGAEERRTLAQVVGAAERAVFFAHTQLKGKPNPPAMGKLVEEGKDTDFVRDVLQLIGKDGSLTAPPFGFPDDRFVSDKR